MFYEQACDAQFDYDAVIQKHPKIKAECPDGICYTLSAHWLSLLLVEPVLSGPAIRMRLLAMNAPLLWHTHFRHDRDMKAATKRQQTILRTLAATKLHTDSVDEKGFCPYGARSYRLSTESEESRKQDYAEWKCKYGDWWGVLYKFVTGVNGYVGAGQGVLLNFRNHLNPEAGHALAAIACDDGIVRVFDMNAGEFAVYRMGGWKAWAGKFSLFYSNQKYNSCECHIVTAKNN